MTHNKRVNKGHSLLRTACEWLRHSVTSRAPQTVPITTGVMCYEEREDPVQIAAALIELKPGSGSAVTDWKDFVAKHRKEALDSLEREGVKVESWFSLSLDGKDYLLCYMRAESMSNSQNVFAESTNIVDEYHRQFKKAVWIKGSGTNAELLLDLVNE